MGQIQIEQAVFASHNNSRIRGYQLIARSPGIDEVVAQQLVRWSPSHDGLPAVLGPATGLSYFPVDRTRVAIGRTTEGGPEYSGRGGRQAFTSFIVTSKDHLAGFENNAWAFMLLARSQGWLRFHSQLPDVLPPLVTNATWAFGRLQTTTAVDEEDQQELVAEAGDYLRVGKRVAVLETQDPESILRQILTQTDVDQRAGISFAIGLQPSSQRPFQLQFPADIDVGTRSDLSRDGVKLLRPRTTVQSRAAWDRYE